MADTLRNSTHFDSRSDPERRELFAEEHSFTVLVGFGSVKCCIHRVLKYVLALEFGGAIAAQCAVAQDAAGRTNDDSIGRVGLGRLRRRTSARLHVSQTRLNPLLSPAIFKDARLL